MIIWHNPRCSKSRQTLKILEEAGASHEVRLYLEDVPSSDEIQTVLGKLGLKARELLRTSEQDYKDLGLKDPSLTEHALLEAMHSHPKLIERPIVISGSSAVIGRPPENVESLLG